MTEKTFAEFVNDLRRIVIKTAKNYVYDEKTIDVDGYKMDLIDKIAERCAAEKTENETDVLCIAVAAKRELDAAVKAMSDLNNLIKEGKA
jgi:hypothetical protein